MNDTLYSLINDLEDFLVRFRDMANEKAVAEADPIWERDHYYRNPGWRNRPAVLCAHVYPTGEAILVWGDERSMRQSPLDRAKWEEVPPVRDDGSIPEPFQEPA